MLTSDEIYQASLNLPDEGDPVENLHRIRQEIMERFKTIEMFSEYLQSRGSYDDVYAEVKKRAMEQRIRKSKCQE